jgi:ABC-2 type transport system permease protein
VAEIDGVDHAERPLGAVRAYLLLMRAWNRAAWQYRASLAMLTAGQFLVTCLDGLIIVVMFTHTSTLAGFTLSEVLFLYGTTRTSFAIADVLASGAEGISALVRRGEFDVVLIRPVSTLAQVLALDFSPKRFGKLAQALVVLVAGLVLVPVRWDAGRALMVPTMICCGAVIYCALWVLGGAFQIVTTDAAEVVNAFTYGSELLTEYPLSVYGRDLGFAVTFGLPMAFVNWQPTLYVLDLPDPLGLPYAFRFASPAVAALLTAVAGIAWRAAVRRYRSTGS